MDKIISTAIEIAFKIEFKMESAFLYVIHKSRSIYWGTAVFLLNSLTFILVGPTIP